MLPCLPRRQGHRFVHPPPLSHLTVVCYERIDPSDLLCFDVKKLARIVRTGYRITGDPQHDHFGGAGWEYLHIAIDDITWMAFAKPLPDESATCARTFLHAILALIVSHVVILQNIYSANGSCYRSHAMRDAVAFLGFNHRITKPYTTKTNGKAERFIQISLRERAFAHAYSHADQRSDRLPFFLHNDNWHRPHHSLKLLSLIYRLRHSLNNL